MRKDRPLTISRKRAIDSLFNHSIPFRNWYGVVHMMVIDGIDRGRMISVCGLFRTNLYYIQINDKRVVKWRYSRERCKLCEKRLKEVMA